MKQTIRLFSCTLLLCIVTGSCFTASIEDYSLLISLCKTSSKSFVGLRKFKSNSTINYLVVDPSTLETKILPEKIVRCEPTNFLAIRSKFKESDYIKAIERFETNINAIQDAGITHFLRNQTGIDLTVDLCPSTKPLDRILFNKIINEFSKAEMPVPVAISITGNWLEKHSGDIDWLIGLDKNGLLKITWVNHSYTHRYSKKLPLQKNFLLEKGTDVKFEVLQNEKILIEKGLMPSIFFRFPGLISDSKDFSEVTSFGLIVVGTDAWLGKNEWPKNGSIVLVHANGNEVLGIERFIELMTKEKKNIHQKKWILYDLRESLLNEANEIK